MNAKTAATPLPVLVIVGRPNVGKSTLFNALTRTRRSIVGDEPGITRDHRPVEGPQIHVVRQPWTDTVFTPEEKAVMWSAAA